MATCAETDFDCEHFFSKETVKECVCKVSESVDGSTEETHNESEETNETKIESKLRANEFLRRRDSEADLSAKLENKNQNKSEGNSSNDKESDSVQPITSETKETVICLNSTGDSISKTQNKTSKQSLKWTDRRIRRKEYTEEVYQVKWGEAVGITDSKGRPKRLVSLSEVKNYIPLKMRNRNGFKFYFSLINCRYPQLFRKFSSDRQRWRMRYNVFVEGIFTSAKVEDSILHMGEIILYFDIGKNMSHPFYTNCSFYANYRPLDRSVNTSKLTKLIFRLHDILTSDLMLQLKFPVTNKAFKNIDGLHSEFVIRQKDLMNELQIIRSRQILPSTKWLSIDHKIGNSAKNPESEQTFEQKNVRKRSDNRRRRSDRKRGTENRNSNPEERGRSTSDKELLTTRNEEQHSKRNEYRIDQRFVSSDKRRRNPSNRRKSDQTFGSNPFREKSSNYSHQWREDRNRSKNSSQRRNRNTDRVDGRDGQLEEVGSLRTGGREEQRSRPKTRR